MKTRRTVVATALLALLAIVAVIVAGAVASSRAAPAAAAGPVVLTVKHNGTAVKTYTLDDMKALPVYSGYAGFITSGGTVHGPDPVTGVKVADVLQDAFGAAMTTEQSVDVHAPDDYGMTYTYGQIVEGTPFEMINATTKQVEPSKAALSSILVYARNGIPLEPFDTATGDGEGPLRFYIAQLTDENQIMDGSLSVSGVSTLNLRDQALPEWSLKLVGLKIRGVRQVVKESRNAIEGCSRPGCHGSGRTISGVRWRGVPLWRLLGVVDGGARHKGHSYNATLARKGYRIRLFNAAGKYVTISSKITPYRNGIVLANQARGAVLKSRYYPLRLVGPAKWIPSSKRLGRIVKIKMLPW